MDEELNRLIQLRNAQTERLRRTMPISVEMLKELLAFLGRPDAPECDHTLRETTLFIESHHLDGSKVIQWLRENGGYCDCEVALNVYDAVGDIVGWHLNSVE